MFSPQFLAAFALLAAVTAIPVSDNPSLFPQPITTIGDEVDDFSSWFRGPWDSLFSSVWKLIPSFADIGPKITADNEKFKVVVNAKNYKKNDLKVKLKDDFIFVQGSHEATHDDKDVFASQFFHTYSLPVNASAADVTAELYSDGFLVVTAPFNGAGDKEPVDREVTITEVGAPYNKEETSGVEKGSEPSPTALPAAENEGEKKELTTPSDREDITEKDNVIPHGIENQP
ncbi:unnamed protein product [Parnassius apollo]|uniref:(apollo) hypothetical protein n=1 Tax=Parnassius apollo TaxID=110799 RepID=A0A8S3WGX0_PARAO|nr:unnamed protein product [Parnassius apollo]